MKVKPIIFNVEMVEAILAGRKTITRRPMKPQPEDSGLGYKWFPSNIVQSMVQVDNFKEDKEDYLKGIIPHVCPIACKGDLVYVRETFCHQPCGNAPELTVYKAGYPQADLLNSYESVMGKNEIKWTPSIHMPRKHSRLTLKVTDVRIEKVQDISEDQAKAEGVKSAVWFAPFGVDESEWINLGGKLNAEYRNGFATVWDSIYQDWDNNPYVWVIEFEVINQNVDKYLESL